MQGMQPVHVAQYPGIEPTISDWLKLNKVLEGLAAKNERDMAQKPKRWDLNDILVQELYHVRMIMARNQMAVKVVLSSHKVNVYGFGRDFSIALNPLIKGCMFMVEDSEKPELKFATKLFQDEVLLEAQATGVDSINAALNKAVLLEKGQVDEKTRDDSTRWKKVFEAFLEPFAASMDLSKVQDKIIIRLRIPVLDDANVHREAREKTAKLPVL